MKKFPIILFFALFFISQYSHFAIADEICIGGPILLGYVTDSATGLRIAGASVQVTDAYDSGRLYYLTTLEDGAFVKNYNPITTVNIWVTKTGYISGGVNGVFAGGCGTTRADIQLTPRYCKVQGYISDSSNGAPIAGGLVISGINFDYSDCSGFYEIRNIAGSAVPGTSYTFTASKLGYTPNTKSVNCIGGTTQNLDFSSNCVSESCVVPNLCYVDCGLRIYDGTAINTIACEPLGTVTSPLRIFNGLNTYGIVLVDTSDAYASKARIYTPSGIKALRRL